MKKRFLAILLCLSVLLMACACAAETAVPPAASQPVSKEPAPQFTLSEVNAESSKTEEPAAPSENAPAESEPEETISIEESDVVIEPIQPIVPEEKETTLEKVLSFKTGENGLFTYGFVYAEDPANPTIGTPVNYCVDSKGNIYVAHADIICLNTGERFSYSSNYSILDMKVCGKSMFVLYMDGMVQEFDLSNGISKATIAETYLVNSFDPSSFAGDLFVIDENKPLLKIGSDELFSLNGTLLKGNERPFAMSKNVSDSAITKENGQPYIVYSKDEKKPNVLGCSSKGISTVINQNYVSTNFIKSESLYSWYDPKGNLQSEFLYGFETGKTVSCELSYPAGILSQYQGWNVRVDDVAFEDVLSSHIIVTSDETYYLILYYANYGVVYKIVAGYSGIKLSDLELLSHQTAEGAEAVVAVTSALPAPSSRDQVIREVSRIIQTPWTLLEEHVPETPPSNVTIPTYIKNTVVGTSMRGIPYCWGGFNSREEFMVLADSGLYIPGNTRCIGVYKPGTIGLDCSGFVGLVTGVRMSDGSKPNTSRFVSYGHAVNSLNDLQEWDIIVKSGSHVMLYLGTTSNGYRVCDVSTDTNGQKTTYREVELTYFSGYSFRHIYQETGYSSTQHWTGCASCTEYRTYENHTLECTYSGHLLSCTGCDYFTAVTPHTFIYTYSSTLHSGTCSVCGYTEGASHSFTTSGDADGHVHSCICGYSIPGEHNFTYTTYSLTKHRKTCSTCGYSALAPHLLGYSYDADGHWQECSVCSYETASFAHNFANSECTVCGCPQFIIMDIIAIPEEDEPLPVPEDQKATL